MNLVRMVAVLQAGLMLATPGLARPIVSGEGTAPVRVRVAGKATITVWPGAPAGRTVRQAGQAPALAAGPEPRVASVMVRPATARPGVALSSRFGARVDPFQGTVRRHDGLDFRAAEGSPVIATAPGVVSWAGWRNGYGNLVVVDHGGALQTRFGHLSRTYVRAGERIDRGAILGLVGSTGRSTGPHLHYEVRVDGRAIDPRVR